MLVKGAIGVNFSSGMIIPAEHNDRPISPVCPTLPNSVPETEQRTWSNRLHPGWPGFVMEKLESAGIALRKTHQFLWTQQIALLVVPNHTKSWAPPTFPIKYFFGHKIKLFRLTDPLWGCEGKPTLTNRFPSQRTSYADLWCCLCYSQPSSFSLICLSDTYIGLMQSPEFYAWSFVFPGME